MKDIQMVDEEDLFHRLHQPLNKSCGEELENILGTWIRGFGADHFRFKLYRNGRGHQNWRPIEIIACDAFQNVSQNCIVDCDFC
jgi:hypothetical protein